MFVGCAFHVSGNRSKFNIFCRSPSNHCVLLFKQMPSTMIWSNSTTTDTWTTDTWTYSCVRGSALFSNHNGPQDTHMDFPCLLNETCYTSHHDLCMPSLCRVLSHMIRTRPWQCAALSSLCRHPFLKLLRAFSQILLNAHNTKIH
jgi:hypothetical protein